MWTIEDFLQKASEAEKAREHPLSAKLATWSDSDIRKALNESFSKPEWLLSNSPTSQVARALLSEWIKRESDRVAVAQRALGLRFDEKQLKAAMKKLPRQEQMAAVLAQVNYYTEVYRGEEAKKTEGHSQHFEEADGSAGAQRRRTCPSDELTKRAMIFNVTLRDC